MFGIKKAIKKALPQSAEQAPKQEQNVSEQKQGAPEQNQNVPEQTPIKLIWIILGVGAIILMWLLSSWLF